MGRATVSSAVELITIFEIIPIFENHYFLYKMIVVTRGLCLSVPCWCLEVQQVTGGRRVWLWPGWAWTLEPRVFEVMHNKYIHVDGDIHS